jgi:hypothetical protein
VAAHELRADRVHHVPEGEAALFLGHARVEHHLEEQVAELLAQGVAVAALDGVGHLVGLLDRVGRDALEALGHVPRAAALRRSQAGHDLEQAGDVAHGAGTAWYNVPP